MDGMEPSVNYDSLEHLIRLYIWDHTYGINVVRQTNGRQFIDSFLRIPFNDLRWETRELTNACVLPDSVTKSQNVAAVLLPDNSMACSKVEHMEWL